MSIVAGGLLMPAPAHAQTLVPPTIFGGSQSSADSKPKHGCSAGVTLLCAAESVTSTAVNAAGDVAQAAVGGAANAVLGGVVGWAAQGATWLLQTIGKEIDRSTRPALGSPWFARRYAAMRDMGVTLALGFLLAAILQATLRQDLRLLVRSVLVALPLGMLLTFAAVTLTELALALTDALTTAALSGTGSDAQAGLADMGKVLAPTAIAAPGLPGLVLFLGAILTAVLGLVVWIELVLREAAVYVAVAFLPIVLAAIAWQRTAPWSRRLAEWLLSIVLAKFVIAVSFAIAGAMMGNARGGSGGLSALLGGCAVLLLAALSPWVLLRLIPFAEQAAGSLQRSHLGGAMATLPGAAAGGMLVRQAMVKSFGASMAAKTAAQPPASQWTPPARPVSGTGDSVRPSEPV